MSRTSVEAFNTLSRQQMNKTKPKFVVKELDFGGTSVLPEGFDTTNLVEVTELDSRYVKYVNTVTGEIIDCETYTKQLEELKK